MPDEAFENVPRPLSPGQMASRRYYAWLKGAVERDMRERVIPTYREMNKREPFRMRGSDPSSFLILK
jgi:hypothetical protein